jgi:hypothetical protein
MTPFNRWEDVRSQEQLSPGLLKTVLTFYLQDAALHVDTLKRQRPIIRGARTRHCHWRLAFWLTVSLQRQFLQMVRLRAGFVIHLLLQVQ